MLKQFQKEPKEKRYTKNPLGEISGFNRLIDYYNKHKNTNWEKWLKFDKILDKPGKQGTVGLLNTTQEEKSFQFVFKISKYVNYLVQHEYTVMKGLEVLSPYCPHFCKPVGTLLCEIDPQTGKGDNPFLLTTKHPIEKEILLTEYIDNSCKLYNCIRSSKITDNVLYSTIKQVLMAISMAQRKKNFTHYDLHSNNVMMKKCNKDVVFLYVLDEDNQFCIPTHGHYPMIIDFGFSYISDLDDGPAWPSMGHTDVGFMSDRYDWVADPKLFLVTVAGEMREQRKNKKAAKFKRIVKNIFGKLKINWLSGWDVGDGRGASDYALEILQGCGVESNLFDNYDHYCIDLIQSLIILPFEEQTYENIHKNYQVFLKEFIKIENEIGNPFYNLYILKGIVDVAREVRYDYMRKKSRNNAVRYFRRCVFERVNCVANYCQPKGIHFERMLCSLFCLAKNLEGILFDVMEDRMAQKKKQYDKMPIQSTEQIYGILEANIPDKYVFNKNTTVFVMNGVTEECSRLELNEEDCETVNNVHPLGKGTFLYSLCKK